MEKMKQQTHDEHECYCNLLLKGELCDICQGYAKALDDVRKAVGNKIILLNATEDSLIKSSENYPDLSGLLAERIKELDDMLKEIAKLESK